MSTKSKLILVSFADKRYRNSLKRLEEQTKDFPFDERYFLTQDNCLTKSYWRRLKPWFYRRGYGYWNWKFRVVNDYIERLSEGDKLFYSDAGITWNATFSAIERFKKQLTLVDDGNDVLVYDQPTIEQEWTKGDVLDALGVYDNEEICKSRQIYSGFFCIKKTERTCRLLKEIISFSDIEKELVTDKRSSKPNKTGFVENRHDQSIFSVMVKKGPHAIIHYSENYEIDNNGMEIKDCPIQVIRRKEIDRSLYEVIKNKMLRPWRDFLGFYFTKIRHYEYTCDHFPW